MVTAPMQAELVSQCSGVRLAGVLQDVMFLLFEGVSAVRLFALR